jgi:ATP-dependent protease HslVU (ClpYQ), ATPase subunit
LTPQPWIGNWGKWLGTKISPAIFF